MAEVTIPSQIADIDVGWLNQVLGDDFGEIATMRVERFGEGVGILGELARLHLDYVDGAFGPATLVAKCASPSEENQFLAIAMGFYVREVSFYQGLATDLEIRVPSAYYAEVADVGVPFVLLIEDIGGAMTPDQIAGLSAEQVAKIIATIAKLHIQFWGTDELFALDWLPPMNNDKYKGAQPMATALFPSFAEHYGDRIPADFMETIGRSCERYSELLDYAVTIGTPTFTHTDCRAEN